METVEYYDEDKSRWKWLILFASFWSHAITWGMAYTAGIFQVIFMEIFGGPGRTGMISVIPTCLTTCLTFFGLLSSVLTNRFGYIKVGWAGTVLAISGFLLSSTANSVWFLYITFSLIGVGMSLAYLPSVIVVCQYFTHRRPLAMGVASAGAPAGTFIFPPLVRMLVNNFGWRGAFLGLAALSLNLGVAVSFFRPIKSPENHQAPPAAVENDTDSAAVAKSIRKRKRKIIRVKVLRQSHFRCLLFNNLTIIFGFVAFYQHLPAYLMTTGVSEDSSAIFVSVCGAAGIVGRLGFALVAQNLKESLGLYNCLMTVAGVSVLLVPFFRTYSTLIALCAIFGLTSSTMGSLLPLVIAQLVGKEALSDGYGYLLIAEGFGCLLGPVLSGSMYDATDSFVGSLCLAGIAVLVGCVVMIISQMSIIIKNWKQRKECEMFRQISVASTKRLVSTSSGDSGFLEEDFIQKSVSANGSDEQNTPLSLPETKVRFVSGTGSSGSEDSARVTEDEVSDVVFNI